MKEAHWPYGRNSGTRATEIEILGANGTSAYRVRYQDGHESEIFPGTGRVIDKPHPTTNPKARSTRTAHHRASRRQCVA
jgi:hypothetical protein